MQQHGIGVFLGFGVDSSGAVVNDVKAGGNNQTRHSVVVCHIQVAIKGEIGDDRVDTVTGAEIVDGERAICHPARVEVVQSVVAIVDGLAEDLAHDAGTVLVKDVVLPGMSKVVIVPVLL